MQSRLATFGFFLITVATLTAQSGQPSGGPPAANPQQPTFVAGTQYVRVDVYVTRDGQLVEDLRPEEISVFEDEVPQTIDSFERIVFRAPDRFVQPVEARTLDTSLGLVADSRSRVFVVFFDPWHASYVNDTATQRRFPVLRTLDSVLGPDDLVAVMTPEMRPEDLTFVRGLRDLAALEGEWLGPESIINRDPIRELDDLELVCGLGRVWFEKRVLDALESLAAYLGDLREERKAVLVVSDGWRLYFPSTRAGQGGGEPPRLPDPPIAWHRVSSAPVTSRSPR